MSVPTTTVTHADHEIDEVGTALIHLVKAMERTYHPGGPDGLERHAWGALFRVHYEGPMRSTAIAECVGSDPSTISRHVSQLVERGLLRRTADPSDGRATLLATTDAGDAACRSARARRNDILATILADFSADDRADFVRLLERFTDRVEQVRPELQAAVRPTTSTVTTPGEK